MRLKTLAAAVAVIAALALAQNASAQDPTGVWKMNPAKSKFSGAAPKSTTITTTAAGKGMFKSVND